MWAIEHIGQAIGTCSNSSGVMLWHVSGEVALDTAPPIRIKLSEVPNQVPPPEVGLYWDEIGVVGYDSPISSHGQSSVRLVRPLLHIKQS